MIRINLLAVSLVSALAFTGCTTTQTPPAADSASKAVTDSTGAAKDKAIDAAGAAKDTATNIADTTKDKAVDAAAAAKDTAANIAGATKDTATNIAGAAGTATDKAIGAAGMATDKAIGAAGTAKNAVTGAAGAAKDKLAAVSGITGLAGVVTSTKSAIDAGNFEQAKMEIAKFDTLWAKVGDGIKSKSPAAYEAISKSAVSVAGAVNSEDKTKALDGLKALGNALTMPAKP